MGFSSLILVSLALAALIATASAGPPYCEASNSTCFPPDTELAAFNKSVDGRLIKNKPYGLPCYKATYNAAACIEIAANKGNASWRVQQPAAVMYPIWENSGGDKGCPVPPLPANGSAPAPLEGNCTLGSVSPYIVNASCVDHIVNTVKVAAKYNLRLRIKNSGHDYFGRSSSQGALTIWTHYMSDTELIEDFKLCGSSQTRPVVSAGPGMDVEQLYAITGKYNYVSPGGYTPTVGVSGGFVLGGGTGPLGSIFGMGVDNVVQFEVVTADGKVKVANGCTNVDLFWALRGGGGAFGVVTRAYFKVYPAFDAVNTFFGQITCPDNASYANLISQMVDLQVPLRDAGQVGIWQAYGKQRAVTIISLHPLRSNATEDPSMAQKLYNPALGANRCNSTSKVAQFTGSSSWNDAYKAFILPIILKNGPVGINIFNLSRLVSYDLMKSKEKLQKVKEFIANLDPDISFLWQNDVGEASTKVAPDATSVHPDWRNAFAFVNIPVVWPWDGNANLGFSKSDRLMWSASKAFDTWTAYSNEDMNFERDFQQSFWGENYPRLIQIKEEVDPDLLFQCPSCVGSEATVRQ
ncbi:hypothetical protein BDV96DRAFT_593064 [Lophiotrema nucula]|uniref:FAD-binding PCMH-type domain-containing protein n=1 Tax=Lophiotrema nucula TaxID=690887 RepID=A0A6A5ZS36_9PLEO|nr:hypothetical protein BDV96DRAFT_593064 [Lophiotrema nucula]